MLFNHVLTKTLRYGTANLFSLKRYGRDITICPVMGIEVYIKVANLLGIPIATGYLFRPMTPSGDVSSSAFDSAAAQSRLASYIRQLPQVFRDQRPSMD